MSSNPSIERTSQGRFATFAPTLMSNEKRPLIRRTKNVQAARQIRFTNVSEVMNLERVVKDCIREAIAVEKSGRHVELKKTAEFDLPEEFKSELKKLPALKEAFHSLTPGR